MFFLRNPFLLLAVAIAACATSERGRVQWAAPGEVGSVYSAASVQARLAFSPETRCRGDACARFRQRVADTGSVLAQAAFVAYPDLSRRVPGFEFIVPERAGIGTLSTASGKVLVLAGLDDAAPDDAALAFVIGREMGRVIGRQHEEDSGVSILVSAAAQLLLPLANVITGFAALPLTTGLTATAASIVGSSFAQAANREVQRDEADAIALRLMKTAGWDLSTAAPSLEALMNRLARFGDERWIADLAVSKLQLDQRDCGRAWPGFPPPALAVATDGVER